MKPPFISVIIPTLEEERFLPNLLRDLQKQKEKDFEVIVVDAHSKDNTREVALSVESLNIQVCNVKKRNVSFQRNYGAKRAKGTYLVFLDADARVKPSFLKRVRDHIKNHQKLIIIPKIKPQNKSIDAMSMAVVNSVIELSQYTKSPFSSGGSMIFHRAVFEILDGFDTNLFISEDHDIVQRARHRGIAASLPKNVIVHFSTRRLERDGRLESFRKYLIAAVKVVSSQKIDSQIFEYEMGGSRYVLNQKKQKQVNMLLKTYFRKIRRRMDSMF